MLEELQVENLALIERLDIAFKPGLTVLTGETGAGKTVIIDALNLALGERAESGKVRLGSEAALVKALFYEKPIAGASGVADSGDELLLERKISADGRSRSNVNGALVTLGQLAERGTNLVDIHGQHEHQSLFRVSSHLELLDSYARGKVLSEKERFTLLMAEKKALENELSNLKASDSEKEARKELLLDSINEIDVLRINIEEDEAAETDLNKLRNFEKITRAVFSAQELISADETGGFDLVQRSLKDLAPVLKLDQGLTEIIDQLSGAAAQLEDAKNGFRRFLDDNRFDPDRLNWLEERVFDLSALKRKYGGTIKSVIEYRSAIAGELAELEKAGSQADLLEERIASLTRELTRSGSELSNSRKKAAVDFEREVLNCLRELGMSGADFKVVFQSLREEPLKWRKDGFDQAEFFVTTNKGEKLSPLIKVASGGEISRVMLALKTTLSDVDQIDTLVFDEIDSGIGGKTATFVGKKLSALAQAHQVICITHLPQIAVFADNHFYVSKIEKDGRTVTIVKDLTSEERVAEISRMSGVETHSDVSISHVKELLKAAEREKAASVSTGT